MSFSAEAVLVKTNPSAPPPVDVPRPASFITRTEKKNITRKRLVPPGDGRFFDGHH